MIDLRKNEKAVKSQPVRQFENDLLQVRIAFENLVESFDSFNQANIFFRFGFADRNVKNFSVIGHLKSRLDNFRLNAVPPGVIQLELCNLFF